MAKMAKCGNLQFFIAFLLLSRVSVGQASTTEGWTTFSINVDGETETGSGEIDSNVTETTASTSGAPVTTASSTTTTTPAPTDPTTPVNSVTPPPIARILSLEFSIIYYQASGNGTARRRLLWVGPLTNSLSASQYSMQVMEAKNNLTQSLTRLYQNATNGFQSLEVTSVPNTTECSSTTGNEAKYTVNYNSAILTEDCQTSAGCRLTQQIADNVMPNIATVAKFGNCDVDNETTAQSMENTVQQVAGTLENPCLMNENVCTKVGRQYTCVYDKPNYYCLNVCNKDFCGGGLCYAEHVNNDGFRGVAKCSCLTFRFLSNDRCVSWWAVFGPLLAVTVIALLLVVVIVVMKRRSGKEEKDSYNFGAQYTNPAYSNGPHDKGMNGRTPLSDQNAYMRHYEKIDLSARQRQENLQQYASLSSEELAQRPENRDFQPQLDKVPTDTKVTIPRTQVTENSHKQHVYSSIYGESATKE